ncbi:VOC family protein [Oscillatoria sp. FACHB-1407]|uniref:VOC family protein n=1 Tax=Oscillatoria sp. FACHB-1407 TaxID=2692847 RepID=UPI001685CE62|nr:VOC family protein [Oscillatoria sp. FACHB-1407]MBD2463631.1 VOC family protein [Oscillatoria sp. FACHB-1407]
MKALFAPLALTFSLFLVPYPEFQPQASSTERLTNSSSLNMSQSLETPGEGLETLQIYNVAISVANLDESIEWYEDKLGFQLENRRNVSTGIEIALIEKNGFFIDLIYIAGSENVEGNPQDPPDHLKVQGLRNLVFWVDDLQATDAELKSNGVQLIWESRYIPEVGTSVTNFRDNNGNLIAIWER